LNSEEEEKKVLKVGIMVNNKEEEREVWGMHL